VQLVPAEQQDRKAQPGRQVDQLVQLVPVVQQDNEVQPDLMVQQEQPALKATMDPRV
jgi:hypothetical protein